MSCRSSTDPLGRTRSPQGSSGWVEREETPEVLFVGDDWAEDHHDVLVLDEAGSRLGGGRLSEGVEGVARFHALVADLVEDPAEVVVATETTLNMPWRSASSGG